MRHVDNAFIDLPEGWEVRAQQATENLLNGEIEAEDQAQIWRDLKDSLADASHDRCWYCETGMPRTDNAVDHYRPKGRVKGAHLSEDGNAIVNYQIEPEHLGYKWAAFELENFRFSCQHCNEYRKDLRGTAGGKSSYFPLVVEENRAFYKLDQDNEVPALLDPCNVLDWRLLSFDKSGKPFSRFPPGSDEDLRVRYSIIIYHLDQENLNKSRAQQWEFIKPLIRDTKKWHLKNLRGDLGANACFQEELKKLRRWFHPKSKNAYLGFLLYQLEKEKEMDKENIHGWINELIRVIG